MRIIKTSIYLSIILLTGCIITGGKEQASNSTPEPIEDFTGPEEVSKSIANKILDRTMKGIKENSYGDFSYRFNADLKKRITKKAFEKMCSNLSASIGEYESREYLGTLQKGPLNIYLWKGKFSKAKNNDLVIRLTLGKLDEAVQVFAFEISNR